MGQTHSPANEKHICNLGSEHSKSPE